MGYVILVPLIIFFAMNMGASGFAPAMAAPYGAGFLTRRNASIVFTVFVFIGAMTTGSRVGKTLSSEILPTHLMDIKVLVIIIATATVTLFLANILKVPQSTSQVTVGALVGAGLYFGEINAGPFALMLPLWVALPVTAYLLVLLAGKVLFPRLRKYVLAQQLMKRYRLLQVLIIASSCYAAFTIGSNNVANAVGPMVGAGIVDYYAGAALVSPLFGVGSVVLGKGTLETAGKEITPLGVLSATLVSLVAGSLLILASLLGMPASEVQIMLGAIFGVGVVQKGHRHMLGKSEVQRAALVWVIAPVLSVGISYLLFILASPSYPVQ